MSGGGVSQRLQLYETDLIRVTFDPQRCLHSGVCLRTLPAVFDISRRRWIDPRQAAPDAVMAAVAKCPSGALQSTLVTAVHPSISAASAAPAAEAPLPAGDAQVVATGPVTITVRPGNSLLVEGEFRVVDAEGRVLREGPKCALCRCGHSRSKPFCDGSHATARWE